MEANIFVDGIEINGSEDRREIYLLSLLATQRDSSHRELRVVANLIGTGERSESTVDEPVSLLSVNEDVGFLALSLAVIAADKPANLHRVVAQYRGHPALVAMAKRLEDGAHVSSGPVANAVKVFLGRVCVSIQNAGIGSVAMRTDLEMASVLDLQDSFEWSQGDARNWCKLIMRCSLRRDLGAGIDHPTRWADVEPGMRAYYRDMDGEMLDCTVALSESGSALLITDPDGQGEQREFHVERLKDFWLTSEIYVDPEDDESVPSTPEEENSSGTLAEDGD